MKKRQQLTDGQGDLLDHGKARDWGWVSFMWGDLQGLFKEVAGEWPGKYPEGSGRVCTQSFLEENRKDKGLSQNEPIEKQEKREISQCLVFAINLF